MAGAANGVGDEARAGAIGGRAVVGDAGNRIGAGRLVFRYAEKTRLGQKSEIGGSSFPTRKTLMECAP